MVTEGNGSNIARNFQVLSDEPDDTLLKVAFASSDKSHVDQHFGSSRSFVIYGVNQDRSTLLKAVEFGELKQDGNEDKLIDKLQLLDGCIAVYCRACGASAIRQLLTIGIQPVKVTEGLLIKDLLTALQNELKQGPSSWLAKAISRHMINDKRFNEMEMEGWDE